MLRLARRFTSARFLRQGATPTGQSESALSNEVPGYRKSGVVPTDYELVSGTERKEYLAKLRGSEQPWEALEPIYLNALGTKKNPVIVTGHDSERYIGCTGFPVDSHEPVYLTVRAHKNGEVDRCPHCGNAFKYVQLESEHH